jgi:hypothetical protein
MNNIIYHRRIENNLIPANSQAWTKKSHCTRIALANLQATSHLLIELETKLTKNPSLLLKERIQIFGKSFKQHSDLVVCSIFLVAFSVCMVAAAVFIPICMVQNWAKMKQDILDKKLGWYRSIFEQNNNEYLLEIKNYYYYSFVRYANMNDYSQKVLKDALCILLLIPLMTGPFLVGSVFSIQELHSKFEEDKVVDRLEVFEKASTTEIVLEELSNERDKDGFLIDPLSQEKIPPDQISYPRYLKLGQLLFCLPSLIKSFMSHDLGSGKLKHPTQDRYLSDLEQTQVLNKMEALLGINAEAFLKSFNIYNDLMFRIEMSLEQKSRYEQQCSQVFRQSLINFSPGFRDLSLAEQEQYIALNKNLAFTSYKLANLEEKLDAAIIERIGHLA